VAPGILRYHEPVQCSRWLLWIVLLGCGPRGGQNAPIQAPGGLPVDIQGNQQISISRLRAAIAAGDMSSNDAIVRTVNALYFDSGFVQVKIKSSDDAQHIVVDIREGAQFSFGDLQFQGAGRSKLPGPPFRPGDVFSSSKLATYADSLRSYCADKGLHASVRPLTRVNEKARTIDITIEVVSPDAALLLDDKPAACVPTRDIGRGEALVLRRDEVVTLGPAHAYHFSRICVRDQAAIRICSSAEVRLLGSGNMVIAGRGIGSGDGQPAHLNLRSSTTAKLHVLFATSEAPLRVNLFAPRAANFVYAVTGQAGLTLGGGKLQNSQANLGWNDTHNFPSCF
jgi:hypothetical protein